MSAPAGAISDHSDPAAAGEPRPAGPDAPPRGSRLLAVAVVAGVGGATLTAAVGLVGLALAVAGVYRTVPTLLLGVPLALVVGVPAARGMLHRLPGGRPWTVGAALALLLAVGWTVFAAWAPGQHVLLDRDPSSYQSTAVWLANQGTLDADVTTGGLEVLPEAALRITSAAVYDTGGGQAEFQGNHLSSVLMAVAYDLVGPSLMLRLPALVAGLALLGVYLVAAQAVRRPLVALLAPALLAAGLPWLFAARDTYSEPFTVLLLWAALAVLARLHRSPRVAAAVLAGLLLGATASVRADALLVLAALPPLGAASVIAAREGALAGRRKVAYVTVAAAAAVGVVVGQLDLHLRTGNYAENLSGELQLMAFALVCSGLASVTAVVLLPRLEFLRPVMRAWPRWVAAGAGGLVVLVLLGLWLVRPELQEARNSSPNPMMEGIQRLNGLPVDPRRNYYERSLVWMGWYLGVPALAAAVAGAGWSVFRVLRARASAAMVVVAWLGLGLGLLYWWQPNITPDQLWASRRYVPVVLPCLAVWAATVVAVVATRLDRSRWVRAAVVGVLAAVLVVPPVLRTWPLREMAPQRGYLDVVAEACDLLGDDATVLIIDAFGAVVLQQTIRAWCDVPVGVAGAAFRPEDVGVLATAAAEEGRRLVLLSTDGPALAGSPVTTAPMESTSSALDRRTVAPTLDRAPEEFLTPRGALPRSVPFPLQLHVREVPA